MDFVNQAGKHVRDWADRTMEQLRQMQSTPLGTTSRSGQEEGALWKRMRALPEQEFNWLGDQIAEKVGHANDEQKPCEWCGFLTRHAGK